MPTVMMRAAAILPTCMDACRLSGSSTAQTQFTGRNFWMRFPSSTSPV
jgi:hypothetical protein